MQKWLRRQKTKNEIKYNFLCQSKIHKIIQHIGTTDNPCRTTKSHWTLFKKSLNKEISFSINQSSTFYEFDYDLKLIQKNGLNKYEYRKKIITRQHFVLLLGCDT